MLLKLATWSSKALALWLWKYLETTQSRHVKELIVKINHGSSSKKIDNPLTKFLETSYIEIIYWRWMFIALTDSWSPENMSITFLFSFKREAELKPHTLEITQCRRHFCRDWSSLLLCLWEHSNHFATDCFGIRGIGERETEESFTIN